MVSDDDAVVVACIKSFELNVEGALPPFYTRETAPPFSLSFREARLEYAPNYVQRSATLHAYHCGSSQLCATTT